MVLPPHYFILCLILGLIIFQDSDSDTGVYDLLDPTSAGGIVGNIRLACFIEVRIYLIVCFQPYENKFVDYSNSWCGIVGSNGNRKEFRPAHFVYYGMC